MKMKVLELAAILPISTALMGLVVNAVEYLEPNVQRHVGVLPATVCKHLIDLGEKFGFHDEDESIDDDNQQNDRTKKKIPSQTIDVYDKGSEPGLGDAAEIIENEAIWGVLRPFLPTITEIVKTNRDRESFRKHFPIEPDLNWVFFRKYSPNDKRNSLQLHHDTNMNTVTVELSNEYEGGGLLYIKPLAYTGEISEEYAGGYEWIDSISRKNTSDIVFPELHTGDAIFYNYTVEHGVAPVKSGTRYSMAFFYDMDNPAVREDFEDDDYEGNSDEEELRVELHNGIHDMELDIVLVYDAGDEKEVRKRIFDKVLPGETIIYYAYERDLLRAFVAGANTVVSDIEITRGRSLYTISQIEYISAEEL